MDTKQRYRDAARRQRLESPTTHQPGTEDKVRLMAARIAAGLPMTVDGDNLTPLPVAMSDKTWELRRCAHLRNYQPATHRIA